METYSERRGRLRALFQAPQITVPASVFDPTSARLAALVGFECGVLGGSIASAVVLGAPDMVVLTLSELADQVRRICRASDLPLIVDADHGFGNALSVRRTVEELEAAGAAALSIEDSDLPARYGSRGGELISLDEFRSKLRAAVSARSDPNLILIGRTNVLEDYDETLERVRCCLDAGIDAIFLIGRASQDLLRAVFALHPPPILLGGPVVDVERVLQLGVRGHVQGHPAYYVMLRSLLMAYQTLRAGSASDLRSLVLEGPEREAALARGDYAKWTWDFLSSNFDDLTRA